MKAGVKCLIVILVVIGLFAACKPEPEEEADNPPKAVFAEVLSQFMVVGAGSTADNGLYVDSGEMQNGRPVHVNSSSPSIIYLHFGETGFENMWVIIPSFTDVEYMNSDASEKVPETGWEIAVGSEPAPTVEYLDGISGINQPGEVLEGVYEFSDEDGDKEGETTFQWYRCDSVEDEGTAIDGATGKDFELTDDDLDKFIRFEVTPVDKDGNKGTTIKTEAFGPVIPVPII